ncbi:MAG: MFS transporter [Candidatus Helarchaeota archaeon]
MLNEDKRYYFPILLIFLCFNDIFDSYCTNYPNVIGSGIELEFLISHSIFLIVVGIGSIGTYFVVINQYLSDLFGRRIMLAITLLGMGISSIIISISQNLIQYTIGLFSLYIFFSSDIWPIFLSEQSSEKHRAKYISLILVFGAIGGAFTVPLFRSLLLPDFGWRSMAWFAFLAIPLAFITFLFKESKAYRKMKMAKKVDKNITNSLKNLTKIFSKKRIKSTITISLLGFFVGFNYIFLLLGEPFLTIDKGLSVDEVNFIITIIAIGAIIGYIASGVISDYVGRKPVICIFSIMMPISMLMMILGDFILSLIGAFLISVSYWSLFITSRMIALEIFPTEIRGVGAGFRSLCYAIGVTIGSFSTAYLLLFIGLGWSFFVNSIFLIIMVPLVILFIKETKGIKLDVTEII